MKFMRFHSESEDTEMSPLMKSMKGVRASNESEDRNLTAFRTSKETPRTEPREEMSRSENESLLRRPRYG